MVTSQMMIEREVGNRGSKSDVSDASVNEQRADGSCCSGEQLRCALTAPERGYQVGIPSNLVKFLRPITQIVHYSTKAAQNLNPWAVTGLTDAEGSFIVKLSKVNTSMG